MQRFAEKLNIFQLNKVLIVLCHCGSVWQKGFIKDLEKKRAVVDLRIEEGEESAFVPSLANLQAKQPKNVLEGVV